MSNTLKEEDLYAPLKRTLQSLGYEVKGEVEGCDVVAVRTDEAGDEEPPVIVELKLQLNLKVILQAVDRFAISESVYVGIPADLKTYTRERKRVLKLFRRLGLGLITINPKVGGRKGKAPTGIVHIILDPNPTRPKPDKRRAARLKHEFETRVGDPTPGGLGPRKKQLTAYRQRAILIARHLKKEGATKASEVASDLSEPKARAIMYDNVYGWFLREGKGIYALSERGKKELKDWV